MGKLCKYLMWYAIGQGAMLGIKDAFHKPEPTTDEIYAAHLRERGYSVEIVDDDSDLILYLVLGFCVLVVTALVIFL